LKIIFVFPHVENTWNKLYTDIGFSRTANNILHALHLSRVNDRIQFHIPPLSLLTVAGITPRDYEIEIIDERIQPFEYKSDADVIAMNVTTQTANRAFKISQMVRSFKSNVKIIMGGMHPSVCPDECIAYSDSVCIGEVEYVWCKLLTDIKNGRLKKFYKQDRVTDPKDFPIPRLDLINRSHYLTKNIINVLRGCPNDCTYCAGSLISGKKVRLKPLDIVEKEIANFSGKLTYLVDDNIYINRKYLMQLADIFGSKKLLWFSAAPISIGKDIELLKHLRKNGCITLGIGFESIFKENLNSFHKQYDPNRYEELIKNIQGVGISVYGLFMYGGEYDNINTFEETCEFILKNNIDLVQFTILTPFPGTQVYEKLLSEDRIITNHWEYYDSLQHVVYKHNTLSEFQLLDGLRFSYNNIYSFKNIIKRLFSSRTNVFLMLIANIGYRQAFTSKLSGDD
jgi:radical SAM superfamily enzyme YgiQ (UPF0313 family)